MINYKTIGSQIVPATAPIDHVRHLTQLDLARRLRVSPRTLERWRWLGQGPQFLKIGGRIRYRFDLIEAYESQQLRTSTASVSEVCESYSNPRCRST
jgi:hypothetical protein